MGLFKKRRESKPVNTINTNADFWKWFKDEADKFHKIIKSDNNIPEKFIPEFSEAIKQLNEEFYFLVGMDSPETAELIITAEGNLKNIAAVEDLVNEAPAIKGWKFTANKQALSIEDVSIQMDGFTFNGDNLNFYSTISADYPDEINITLVHPDYSERNKKTIANGCFIFLDNFLGEINSVSILDSVDVVGPGSAKSELIPIAKLKDFLIWRQKEFIEKYDGVRHDTENDNYSVLEASLERGKKLIAVVNTDLLEWDAKASHPWMVTIALRFDGSKNNGMPDNSTMEVLNQLEDEIVAQLPCLEGCLNIGRETSNGLRRIYLACKDFRKPTRVIPEVFLKFKNEKLIQEADYELYKDKYWGTVEKFRT